MKYLDCGCCINNYGDHVWCPTCLDTRHQPDWRTLAENAETECGRLLMQIENLKNRIQSMGELLEENDYVYCHFCGVWRLSEEVTCGDDGDPFCVHCYESWQWQCENCSYRMSDDEGETCPECGGEMKRRESCE